MKERLEEIEERKYCDYRCMHVKFQKDTPLCHTFDIIYCRKYKQERNKGDLCLDYQTKKEDVR